MLVSFIVVARNSSGDLNRLMFDIKNQDYDHSSIEVILVDGASTDSTKQVMSRFQDSCRDFARVLVLDNPKKILAAGWNVALHESRGEVILRVDAHASIPFDFVRKNVDCIETGEAIVGGHRISTIDSDHPWKKTLLLAETSMFGSGIASYRRTQKQTYVATLAHAAYKRDVFAKVGGYDERLARTEDNEIHYRMRIAGYKFLLNPDIKSYHRIRPSFRKMLIQKYLNGYWIGLTMAVSPRCFGMYHFIPLVFVLAVLFLIGAMLWGMYIPLLILLGVHLAFGTSLALWSVIKGRPLYALLLPLLLICLHIAYGSGTLFGLIQIPFSNLRVQEQNQTDPIAQSS